MKRWAGAAVVTLGFAFGAQAATWPVQDAVDEAWRSESGLEIADLVVGEGAEAVEGAVVEVHYTGMLADGSVFDSSIPRGKAFSFRIGAKQVIKGWDLGVAGMKVGGKRRLVIPPELGYGDRAAGPITPGSTLYFEVELLGISEAPTALASSPAEVPQEAFKSRDGVAWADIREGDGQKPKEDELICIAYAAWSGDQLIDDTRAKGQCWWFRYGHDAVIEGLTEGLKTMRVGGTRQIVVPPDLLRGKSPGEPLQSDTPVVFDVTLVRANE